MERQPVESSTIVAVGYDAETCELEIEFRSGGVYRYAAVPEDEHHYLMAAESLGRHFAKHIKSQFQCNRVVLLPVLIAGEPCQGAAS